MTRIQELIQKGKIEIAHNDGVKGLKIYNMDFAKQNIEEIKASKPEIMEYLKIEKAKEEEEEERIATEKATITFLVPGWESHEVSVNTRKDIDAQLKKIANYYKNDMTFESAKASYLKATREKEENEIKKIAREVENAKNTIKKAEKQQEIMTDTEYQVWAKNYNNINNEGGEGYIPAMVTVERLSKAKETLKKYS